MLRVHRWLCREKQRDLERLAKRLRADLHQLQAQEQNGMIDAGLQSRRERLEQSVGNADGALARAREDLAQARVELGHIERREAGRTAPLPEPFRHPKRARARRT